MSDPIDDALRTVAHAKASPDLKARVMASLDDGDMRPVRWWPGVVAAGAAVAVLLAAAWLVRPTPEGPPPSVARASIELPAPPAPRLVAPQAAPPQPLLEAPRLVGSTRRGVQAPGDHERALAPLPQAESLTMTSIAPVAVQFDTNEIAPLAPIAPLPVGQTSADDGGGL